MSNAYGRNLFNEYIYHYACNWKHNRHKIYVLHYISLCAIPLDIV